MRAVAVRRALSGAAVEQGRMEVEELVIQERENLTQRVERLEREARRWRMAFVVTLIGVSALLLTGQGSPRSRVIEAEKFVLKDSNGKIRAVLGPELWYGGPAEFPVVGGQYGLYFYDADGTLRTALRELEGAGAGWQLELKAKGTPSGAYLSVLDGLAALDLRATEQSREEAERESAEWAKKFYAAKTPEERERVLLDRRSEGVQAALFAFPKGTSALRLKHGLGGGFDLYLHRREARMDIEDDKGIARVTIGPTRLETPATGVVEVRPPSSLVLFDKDGKVVFKAP